VLVLVLVIVRVRGDDCMCVFVNVCVGTCVVSGDRIHLEVYILYMSSDVCVLVLVFLYAFVRMCVCAW